MQASSHLDREKFDRVAETLSGRLPRRPALAHSSGAGQILTPRTRAALKAWWSAAPNCGLFLQDVIEACYKTANDLYSQLGA